MNEEMNLTVYDEMATRHNAAYAAFTTIYEAKSPKPVEPKMERDSLFVPIALVIMIFASVLVSGSRTIEEFGGGFIGLMAFAMLEGAIVAYAFYRTRRGFDEKRLKTVHKWANFGLILAFVVAGAANINAVLKGDGETSPEVQAIIHLLVAISAPTLAFISGDILAVETMANLTRERKAKKKYDDELTKWMKGLNDAWAAEKSRWGVSIKVERPSVQAPSNGISIGVPVENERKILPSASTLGHTKQPQAKKIVEDYLAANPDAVNINPLELASMLGVGKSTVYTVLKEHKNSGKDNDALHLPR